MTRNRLAFAILALYLVVGVTHSVVNPIFESSDEWSHFPFVAHVARGNGLPVQQVGEETLWRHEGSQPPLYYLVMGTLTSWIEMSDLEAIQTPNPHSQTGIPHARENKNLIIHTEREAWPWHNTTLAVHLVRLASVLMGAVAVFCTYRLALFLAPDEPGVALFAMALHAFLPMFGFITASVNNDNLLYMLSAIALVLIFPMAEKPLTMRRVIAMAVVLGLAALTKLSGLVLLPIAALAALLGHVRAAGKPVNLGRVVARWLRDMAIIAAAVMLIAGWWYYRNIVLYGDITGLNVLLTFIEGRNGDSPLLVLAREFQGFRINFWGLFGGVNVLMRPDWIYKVLDIVSLVALVGLAIWGGLRLRQRRPARWIHLALGVVYLVGLVVGVARFTLSTPASQGRLIFPGLPVIATFIALGLTGWTLPGLRKWIAVPVAALLLSLSLSAPFTVIRAAYARPPIIAESDIPPTAQAYRATFEGEVELLAFELGQVHPGSEAELPVTLYWRPLVRTTENYSLFIKVFGRDGLSLGTRDAYPGRGTYPTSQWEPGQIIVDTYSVPVKPDPTGPVAARVEAGLYRLATLTDLAATDAQGQSLQSTVLGRVKIAGAQSVTPAVPEQPLDVSFDRKVRLTGYDIKGAQLPGQAITLTLHWAVEKALGRDYTVYLHLLDSAGQQVAQADGPPMQETYPTSLWEPGDLLADVHTLTLPANLPLAEYTLAAGLYSSSQERLPVVSVTGEVTGDGARIPIVVGR